MIAVNVASIINERFFTPTLKPSTLLYVLVSTRSCLYIIILYSHPTALRSFDVCLFFFLDCITPVVFLSCYYGFVLKCQRDFTSGYLLLMRSDSSFCLRQFIQSSRSFIITFTRLLPLVRPLILFVIFSCLPAEKTWISCVLSYLICAVMRSYTYLSLSFLSPRPIL